jgi:hypothetical protein
MSSEQWTVLGFQYEVRSTRISAFIILFSSLIPHPSSLIHRGVVGDVFYVKHGLHHLSADETGNGDPQFAAVEEHQLGRGRRGQPGALFQFLVQLAGAPARMADEYFQVRLRAHHQGVEVLFGGRKKQARNYFHLAQGILAMHGHERPGDRPAQVHGLGVGAWSAAHFAPEILHAFADGPVYHHAQRSLVGMLHQQDHGSDEIRIHQVLRGHQEMSGKRGHKVFNSKKCKNKSFVPMVRRGNARFETFCITTVAVPTRSVGTRNSCNESSKKLKLSQFLPRKLEIKHENEDKKIYVLLAVCSELHNN